MPDFGDNSPTNLPEPRSVEAVLAIALALEKQAESRYSALARKLDTLDTPKVAALLKELAGEQSARADQLQAKVTSGEPLNRASRELAQFLPRVFSEDAAADCNLVGLTPYRVLAFAVSGAQQTFKLYSYLAATADDRVRDFAEHLASEELSRAARLRTRRRRAFHAGRRRPRTARYPAADLVETQADLLAAALAIEGQLAQRLALAKERQSGLSSTCQATRHRLEELHRRATQAGEPNGSMAEELAKFSQTAQTQADADRAMGTPQLLAGCEHAFTFYDAVTSAAADETVMLEAQDLSRAALERIRQVSASVDATGEAGHDGGNQ